MGLAVLRELHPHYFHTPPGETDLCEVSHKCVKGDLEPVLWEEQQRLHVLHVSANPAQPCLSGPKATCCQTIPQLTNGPGSSFGPKASDETEAQQ